MRIAALLLSLVAWFAACDAPGKPLPDNAENRLSMAKVVIKAYPSASYEAALKQRLARMTGAAVAADARQNFLSEVSRAEIERKRIELLTKNFTAEELKALAEFAATPAGRRVLEKLPDFEQDFTDYLAPYLVQALSFGDQHGQRESGDLPATAPSPAATAAGGAATATPTR